MVSGSQSFDVGGGGGNRLAPRFAYTEVFESNFPTYLVMGMTSEQYWDGPSDMVKFYREAFRLRQELYNQQAWLQGMYIYEALVDVSPAFRSMGAKRARPYSKQPYDLNLPTDTASKNKREKESMDKARAFMEAFAVATNKKFSQKKDGDVNG